MFNRAGIAPRVFASSIFTERDVRLHFNRPTGRPGRAPGRAILRPNSVQLFARMKAELNDAIEIRLGLGGLVLLLENQATMVEQNG